MRSSTVARASAGALTKPLVVDAQAASAAASVVCDWRNDRSSSGPKRAASKRSRQRRPVCGGRSASSSARPAVRSGSSSAHVFQSSAIPPPGRRCDASLRVRAHVEPVERLPDGDRVDRRVRQRYRLGDARVDLGVRHARARTRRASPVRLDRDHLDAEREELARQLAGAGGEVEHAPAGQPMDDPVDSVLGVEGPGALVASGDRPEAERVLRHGTTGRGRSARSPRSAACARRRRVGRAR